MIFAAATVVTRLATQRTTVRSDLGEGVLLQAAEELGPDLVAGGEQEEIEEDDLDERVDLDVELPDEHAGQQRAHDGARLKVPSGRARSANPSARVRKIASSGFSRSDVTNQP